MSVAQTVLHPSQNKEKGRLGQHKEGNRIPECWFHSTGMNFFSDKGTIAKCNKVLQKVEIKHQERKFVRKGRHLANILLLSWKNFH